MLTTSAVVPAIGIRLPIRTSARKAALQGYRGHHSTQRLGLCSVGVGRYASRRIRGKALEIGLTSQYSWILTGRILGAVVQAASLTLVARWAGPADFGLFAAAYGISIVAQSFADFGLTQHIVRLRVADPADGRIGAALRLGLHISIVVAVLGSFALAAVALYKSDYWALLLMPLWIASEKQVEAWLSVSLADEKLWHNATSLVLRRLGALGVLLASRPLGVDPVFAYLAGLAIFSLLNWLVIHLVQRDVVTDRSVTARALLRQARQFWANALSLQAMNFDVSLVALVTTPQMAGYYGAASRLTTPLRIVPTSFAAVLFPAAARTAGNPKALVRPIAILTALSTAMYVGLATVLPLIVPALLGPEFEPATDVIRIVCFGLIFAAITSQLRSLMQGWGYLRAVTAISIASTALSLLAITFAAMHHGAVGAGYALAGGFAAQLLLQILTMAVLMRKRQQ